MLCLFFCLSGVWLYASERHKRKALTSAPAGRKKRMTDELTPRQAEFIKNWVNPKSETFGNAKASAIKAGFSEQYAKLITTRECKWMDEANRRRIRMLDKAEGNLESIVGLGIDDTETLKVVADVSKFIAKTLGKDNGWSDRTEMTGKDGKDLTVVIAPELAEKYAVAPSTSGDSEGSA